MNILFYCDEYPPYKNGGIGSVTKIIAEKLAERHNVYVVGYYDTANVTKRSIIKGVTIYREGFSRTYYLFRYVILKILRWLNLSRIIIQHELTYTENIIEKIIKEKKIDILELPDYYKFNGRGRNLIYRQFSVPTVLRIHGCYSFLLKNQGLKYQYAQKNDLEHFRRCDGLSAVSQFAIKYIRENFPLVAFKNSIVIYNPIEDSLLCNIPIAEELPRSKDLLFLGRVSKEKGCYSLIDAFNICAPRYPELQLRVIGKGDIEKAMQMVKPEFRGRVRFLGYCTREIVVREIDNSMFVCIPTYFENFSLAALEVMARRKALIYTNRTSGTEIVEDGVTGLSINPENVNEIVAAISKLYEDANLRNTLAKNAHIFISENFRVSNIIRKYIDFYSKVLSEYSISANHN